MGSFRSHRAKRAAFHLPQPRLSFFFLVFAARADSYAVMLSLSILNASHKKLSMFALKIPWNTFAFSMRNQRGAWAEMKSNSERRTWLLRENNFFPLQELEEVGFGVWRGEGRRKLDKQLRHRKRRKRWDRKKSRLKVTWASWDAFHCC